MHGVCLINVCWMVPRWIPGRNARAFRSSHHDTTQSWCLLCKSLSRSCPSRSSGKSGALTINRIKETAEKYYSHNPIKLSNGLPSSSTVLVWTLLVTWKRNAVTHNKRRWCDSVRHGYLMESKNKKQSNNRSCPAKCNLDQGLDDWLVRTENDFAKYHNSRNILTESI